MQQVSLKTEQLSFGPLDDLDVKQKPDGSRTVEERYGKRYGKASALLHASWSERAGSPRKVQLSKIGYMYPVHWLHTSEKVHRLQTTGNEET